MAFESHLMQNIFKKSSELHAAHLKQWVEVLRDHRAQELQSLAERSSPDDDEDYAEHLVDCAVDARDFVDTIANSVVVSAYHWAEKQLKAAAAWLPENRTKTKLKAIVKYDFTKLADEYRAHGLDFAKIPGFGILEISRQFTNSWKHNPLTRSPKLDIMLGKFQSEFGHLENHEFRDALAAYLGTSTDTLAVCDELIDRVGKFLVAVASAAPLVDSKSDL